MKISLSHQLSLMRKIVTQLQGDMEWRHNYNVLSLWNFVVAFEVWLSGVLTLY